MTIASNLGFPPLGAARELKRATEGYWAGKLPAQQLLATGAELRRRHWELQRAIGGISQKMLTQTLRSLERDGLVQRKVHPVVPPKVEYSLTRLGRTLIEPLHALCRWSEKHLAELQANRARAKQAVGDGL